MEISENKKGWGDPAFSVLRYNSKCLAHPIDRRDDGFDRGFGD